MEIVPTAKLARMTQLEGEIQVSEDEVGDPA